MYVTDGKASLEGSESEVNLGFGPIGALLTNPYLVLALSTSTPTVPFTTHSLSSSPLIPNPQAAILKIVNMSSAGSCGLVALPADIQTLIIAALDCPSPLFTPQYYVHENNQSLYGDLAAKHKDYYDKQSAEQLASSTALLNWSSSCRFYRKLLSPFVFDDVILRARHKSVASCEALQNTDRWQQVTSLVFCGTYFIEEHHKDDPGHSTRIDPLEEFDFDQLIRVLSSLPPNLRKLTLDFPTEWTLECDGRGDDMGDYLDVFDVDEQPEETLKFERIENWRKLIFTVFNAVAKNDLSSKQDFELCLFNIPPLPCSMYWSPEFHRFLNSVGHLKLSFSHFDNGAGWNMNTMSMPVHFASNLGPWFWNHLANIKGLSIDADDSWPFGLAPGRCHIPLALPDPEIQFQHLASLTLKRWLVDHSLLDFLTIHMPALTDLTIADYWADDKEYSSCDAENTPSWADFFTALCRHPTLTHLTLFAHASGHLLLDPYGDLKGELAPEANYEESFRTAWEANQSLQASRRAMKDADTWTASDDARMKRIWPHVHLDDKYGMIFDGEECNAERFTDGSDHEAWLKLCDHLEKRGGACKVVDNFSKS